ncbi:hypothetical protein ElyMa_005115100 [Elysia marginata]|uniref:Uncharacterized protein n=1 Tax=Elysia marginata TaxID=1093978 RepID=A0AAV4JLX4_9GAST|nr:hypothetical protein ElyMa_005115100 [Elysia marginata]
MAGHYQRLPLMHPNMCHTFCFDAYKSVDQSIGSSTFFAVDSYSCTEGKRLFPALRHSPWVHSCSLAGQSRPGPGVWPLRALQLLGAIHELGIQCGPVAADHYKK